MYSLKSKSETIDHNTSLQAEGFGGWECVNIGTSTAVVNGFPLDPNGTIMGRSFTDLHPEVIWDEPIRITFEGAVTNKLYITRFKYTKK